MEYLSELINICEKFEIPRNAVCIVGSSVISDAIDRVNNDIDAILIPSIRNELIVKYKGKLNILKSGTIDFNKVQFSFNRYRCVGINDEELFCDFYTDVYEGFKIVKTELEIAKKIKRNEEKDRLDVILFCNSINSKFADWKLIYQLSSYKELQSSNFFIRFFKSLVYRIIKWGG